MNKIVIDELHFDAAHYLPVEFGKCHNLHGHRYHIEQLTLETIKIVDFNKVKKVIDQYDHCLLIPEKDKKPWTDMFLKTLPCEIAIKIINASDTTVENIGRQIAKDLLRIDGVQHVTFLLYETDTCGVLIDEAKSE